MDKLASKIVLFKIQPNVRLTSRGSVLILEVKEDTGWKEKFYYSWLDSALRGYILFCLKEFSKTDISGDINHIADKIENLTNTIRDSSNKMHEVVTNYYTDPVEQSIVRYDEESDV